MISLDTNVIVRALTQDEPVQARKAAEILRSPALFVTKTVLVETEWVLRKAYSFSPAAINTGLSKLVQLGSLEVEDRGSVEAALAWHAAGIDFADALHVASSASASSFATFDGTLGKRAAKVRVVPRVEIL